MKDNNLVVWNKFYNKFNSDIYYLGIHNQIKYTAKYVVEDAIRDQVLIHVNRRVRDEIYDHIWIEIIKRFDIIE